MKLKNFSAAALASLLLILFLPVFYHVIMYGNNMNYNPDHKIYALYGNKVLLAFALVGVLFFLVIIYFMRKIPTNKYTIGGFVGFALIISVAFYFVNVEISKCIAFYGGWDCGMVANSARWFYEDGELGYDDYYYIFSNNVPITWLLYKLYGFAVEFVAYPYNPEFVWIQFQCLLHAVTVFLSAITVLIITQDVSVATLTLGVNTIFLGLSPWKIIPYTDATPIVFPVIALFCYAVFKRMKLGWKYFAWFGAIFVGVLGGIMKATCYVTLIAIMIVEIVWILINQDKMRIKVRDLMLRGCVLICGFLLATACKNRMYESLNYEYNENFNIGWLGFLYDGLNEESTGACSVDGYNMVRELAGESRETKDLKMLQAVKDRINEKGFSGLVDFWLRKQVMTYNDGTFSWYQEGFFNAWDYENITDSDWKVPLREFYWEDGEDYLNFITLSHGIWLFVLVGVLIEAVMLLIQAIINLCRNIDERAVEIQFRAVWILIFVGIFLFVMLFEGRARYLYTSIPIFSTMAVVGYWEFFERLQIFSHKCMDKYKGKYDDQ